MPQRFPALAAALLLAAPAVAASPFDGTWKTDIAKAKLSDKPEIFALEGGTYHCRSCTPPYSVAADGAFHPVPGHDYYDAVAVTETGPRSVRVNTRKGGKDVATSSYTVAADGRTMAMASSRTNPITGQTAASSVTATRVAPGPAAAHPISGSWRVAAIDSVSDGAALQTLKVEGDRFTLSTPTGEGYSATFGGPPVTQKNDPANTEVSVEKLADNRIVETDRRGGQVVMTYDMTVAPDGRTLTMVVSDKRAGTTDTVVMTKQ